MERDAPGLAELLRAFCEAAQDLFAESMCVEATIVLARRQQLQRRCGAERADADQPLVQPARHGEESGRIAPWGLHAAPTLVGQHPSQEPLDVLLVAAVEERSAAGRGLQLVDATAAASYGDTLQIHVDRLPLPQANLIS